MKDFNKIKDIYENLNLKFDYLNIYNENFDWTKFFNYYTLSKQNILNEEYKKTQEIRNNKGIHIEYLISSHKDSVDFVCKIDLVKGEYEIEPMREDIVIHDYKNVDSTHPKLLLEVFKANPEKYNCKCQFIDKNAATNITNQVGNLAFYVLRFVEYCLKDAILNKIDEISCIEFHILKDEEKRIELYNRIIKHLNADIIFPNEYIDRTTDKKYITYYRYQ